MGLGRTAATGRNAATRTYSPADLPGLKWWVEPDGINGTGSADSWTDKSGNGNTLSETGTNRPAIVTNVLNGFSGIQCVRASSQRLKKTNTVLINGSEFSFALVMRWDDTTGTTSDNAFSNSTAADGVILNRNTSASPNTKWNVLYQGVANQNSTASITVGSFYIVSYVARRSSNGLFKLNRAASAISNSTGFANPGGTASLIIGSAADLTLPASITVVAGFLCNVALSDAQMKFAEDYWKGKYPSLT